MSARAPIGANHQIVTGTLHMLYAILALKLAQNGLLFTVAGNTSSVHPTSCALGELIAGGDDGHLESPAFFRRLRGCVFYRQRRERRSRSREMGGTHRYRGYYTLRNE